MKNFALFIASALLSTTVMASYTQQPQPAPAAPRPAVYSCDDGTILLSVYGPMMAGNYSLELKNATIASDTGLTGTSDQGDCTKIIKQEMTAVAVPVCNVTAPSGNTYRLAFTTGYSGQLSVSIFGNTASAPCQLVQ